MAARRKEINRPGPLVSLTHNLPAPNVANLPKASLTNLLTALKAEEAINGLRMASKILDGAPTTRLATTGTLTTIITVMAGAKVTTRATTHGGRRIPEVDGVLQEPTVSRTSTPTHPIMLPAPSPPLMLVMANKLILTEKMEAVGVRESVTVGEPQREVRKADRRTTHPHGSSNKAGAVRETKNTTLGEVHQALNLLRSSTHHLKAR